jgi:hypothetical protein
LLDEERREPSTCGWSRRTVQPTPMGLGSLRLAELAGRTCGALSSLGLPFVRPFLIHLPGTLCSTGVTRLRRSYGSSDSCRTIVWCPAGLIASWVESSDRSVSNHPSSLRMPDLLFASELTVGIGRLAVPPTWQGSARRHLGFAVTQQARRDDRPNRVRHPTDRSFASWCSPPSLAGTQFLSATEPKSGSDRDFHPAGSTH